MTATSDPIKCKSCTRVLATISPEGIIQDVSSTNSCNTCEQFTALHDAMCAANNAYLPLMLKGDKHRGKQVALAEVTRTCMIFHNYLMNIELLGLQDESLQQEEEGEDSYRRKRTLEKDQEEQQSGENATKNQSSELHTLQQFPHRLASKRSHSITSVPESKRIKFDESVEFRDNYRSYLELNRSGKEYVPGRYEPPEEGYLDTSGSGISALKFTQSKRIKDTWVDVIPQEEKSKSDTMETSVGPQDFGSSEEAISQKEGDRDSQAKTDRSIPGSNDSREERRQRRTKRASGTDTAKSEGSSTSGSRNESRKRLKKSLERADDEIVGPGLGKVAGLPQRERVDAPGLKGVLENVEKPSIEPRRSDETHDVHEGAESTKSRPSNDSDQNVTSGESAEDQEVNGTVADRNTDGETNKSAQIEVARPSSPAIASNKLAADGEH